MAPFFLCADVIHVGLTGPPKFEFEEAVDEWTGQEADVKEGGERGGVSLNM